MFGLSFGELAIIAILALLLLGPDRLPETARMLAKGLRDLRRATDDLKGQIGSELNVVDDVKRTVTGALAGAAMRRAHRVRRHEPPLPPRSPPPPAAADNVPGLEAALVEPEPQRQRRPGDGDGQAVSDAAHSRPRSAPGSPRARSSSPSSITCAIFGSGSATRSSAWGSG